MAGRAGLRSGDGLRRLQREPGARPRDTAGDGQHDALGEHLAHDPPAARADRDSLGDLVTKGDFSDYAKAQVPGHEMADIALALLDGEIARTSGNLNDAIGRFRLAWTLEQALPYNEPPDWHQPTSHLLGAALLQAHRAAEAEAVYRQSLKFYRGDGWALHGLAIALDAEGKTAEASAARKSFTQAWARGEYIPMVMDAKRIEAGGVRRLQLMP